MALKTEKSVEKFGVDDKLKFDAKSGVISLPDDFYEQTLEDGKVGLSLDQVKKLQKHDQEVLSAATLAGGKVAAEQFEAHPELKEISMNYGHGQNTSWAYFDREGTTPVRNVVEVKGLDGGELKKVHKHVKSLFDDINN
jgi:hypothetical protein